LFLNDFTGGRGKFRFFRSSLTSLRRYFPGRILSVKARRKPRGGRKTLQARLVGKSHPTRLIIPCLKIVDIVMHYEK
jgi:hypothetical protein